jgi:hypothetical protein
MATSQGEGAGGVALLRSSKEIVLNTRLSLAILLFVGVILHFTGTHAAFRPQSLLSKIATAALIIYMIAVPIVLWRLRGDRLLRFAFLGVWVAYLVLWYLTIRDMHND